MHIMSLILLFLAFFTVLSAEQIVFLLPLGLPIEVLAISDAAKVQG